MRAATGWTVVVTWFTPTHRGAFALGTATSNSYLVEGDMAVPEDDHRWSVCGTRHRLVHDTADAKFIQVPFHPSGCFNWETSN